MTPLLHLFLHLDTLLPQVLAQYGNWMYAILFAVIFCETGFVFTPFLPGDSLLFAAGALCAISGMSLGWLWLLLVLAAIVGDTVNYRIGALFGTTLSRSRLLNPKHLQNAHNYFEKHGGKAIILGRFIPVIRTFVPFVSGMTKMSYPKFTAFNVVGGSAWVTLFLLSGNWFGQLPWVKTHFSAIILGIMVVSILPMIFDTLRWWWRKD